MVNRSWQPSQADGFISTPGFTAFAGSLVWISLSYSGFNAAVYIAGEAKEARRNVPRAMIFGTLVITAVYLALNAIFLYAPAPEAIAGKPDVAAIAAEAIGGLPLRRVIEALIALSLLSSITAMILTGPRVYARMASDGAMPSVFVLKDGSPPRAAILLQMALAGGLAIFSDLQGLLSYLVRAPALTVMILVLMMAKVTDSIWV